MKLFYQKIVLLFLLPLLSTYSTYGQVFTGDVSLYTQAEVDAFGTNGYTEITGYLWIGGSSSQASNITSIASLSSITSVNSTVYVAYNNNLESISGLDNLSNIGENFIIFDNPNLESLSGIGSIDSIVNLEIMTCPSLTDLDGLQSITYIDHNVKIINNSSLTTYEGLNNLENVSGNMHINGNAVTSIPGFNNLTTIDSSLDISINSNLVTLDGLESLTSVGAVLIGNNSALIDYCALSDLVNNSGIQTIFHTAGNAFNPTMQDMEFGNCSSTFSTEDIELNSVSVLPNPTSKHVQINFGQLKDKGLKVTNTLGQIVYQKENITEPIYELNLKGASGLYFVEVYSNTSKKQFKLVKQ